MDWSGLIIIIQIQKHSLSIALMMVRFDWGDGEPNNYDHHEMCLALWEHHDPFFPIVRSLYFDKNGEEVPWPICNKNPRNQARDYKWNDVGCDMAAHYICEMRCAEF